MEALHVPSSSSETKAYAATPPKLPDTNFDDAAANAVSFGFIATAILISLFLVIGIFERLLRPRVPLPPGDGEAINGRGESQAVGSELHTGNSSAQKAEEQQTVSVLDVGISVVMPGQTIPSYIARPAPYLQTRESGYMAEKAFPGPCNSQTHQNSIQAKVELSESRAL